MKCLDCREQIHVLCSGDGCACLCGHAERHRRLARGALRLLDEKIAATFDCTACGEVHRKDGPTCRDHASTIADDDPAVDLLDRVAGVIWRTAVAAAVAFVVAVVWYAIVHKPGR